MFRNFTSFSTDLKPMVSEVIVVTDSNLSAQHSSLIRMENFTMGSCPPLSKVQGCIIVCTCLLFENLSNLAQPVRILSSLWKCSWSLEIKDIIIFMFYFMYTYFWTLLPPRLMLWKNITGAWLRFHCVRMLPMCYSAKLTEECVVSANARLMFAP